MTKAPTKKTRVKRVLSRIMDLENKLLTVDFVDGGKAELSLNGLPANVMYQLAMLGAYRLISRAPEKADIVDKIRSGDFFVNRSRKYPPIIHVLHGMLLKNGPITIAEVAEKWNSITKEEKAGIRQNHAVRLETLKIDKKLAKPEVEWRDKFLPKADAPAGE